MASQLEHHCHRPDCRYSFYDVTKLGQRYFRLPYCKRVLLECAVRKGHGNDGGENAGDDDEPVKRIWRATADAILTGNDPENGLLFQPGRVVLQDFTGLPALVDLAALRDHCAADDDGGTVAIDSRCPADLVVDNFVQVDFSTIVKNSLRDSKGGSVHQGRFPPPQPPQTHAQAAAHHHVSGTTLLRGGHQVVLPDQEFCSGFEQMCLYRQTFPPPAQGPHLVAAAAAGASSNLGPAFHPTRPPFPGVPPPGSSSSCSGQAVQNDGGGGESTGPDDNPGLPLQEDVCPFHQHMSHWSKHLAKAQKVEADKNRERFRFLRWVDSAFDNITVIPPGTGTWHQLNLEYLARLVTATAPRDGRRDGGVLFPDSVVGTDNHTTMVNGLGVVGWSVGTVDAEAVMFGHPVLLPVLPRVVGVRLHGRPGAFATSSDLVLLITKQLRQKRQSSSSSAGASSGPSLSSSSSQLVFVEFFGPGVAELSIPDRSAVANLCAEYGANMGYFPVDHLTMAYLKSTGRDPHQLSLIETYLKKVHLYRCGGDDVEVEYDEVADVDLSEVQVTVSGPGLVSNGKDHRVPLVGPHMKSAFFDALPELRWSENSIGSGNSLCIEIDGRLHTVRHGSILSASIASCTNTSNPSVMLTAGLLAKKAVEAGLSVPEYVRTSLAPGSGVVTSYLQESGVMPYLYILGFEVVGYGCSTCVANKRRSDERAAALLEAVSRSGLVCCSVMAGNRNFEGRLEPRLKATYLASAPLVVAFALAGRIDIDFEVEPIGLGGASDCPVFLRDIWPSREELQQAELTLVIPAVFNHLRTRLMSLNGSSSSIDRGAQPGGGAGGIMRGGLNLEWSSLAMEVNLGSYRFAWNPDSTFLKPPRYIKDLVASSAVTAFEDMWCLAKFGDEVSSDHISPAGSIVRNSPAADILSARGLAPRQFSSYGARRGNWEIMAAGTFSHLKLRNLMATKQGPYTVHQPSGVPTTIFEAAEKYRRSSSGSSGGGGLYIVAGSKFGRGSPRDWATKGPLSLGIRAILAVSFDEGYRANVVKSGILPLGISRSTWDSIDGSESLSVDLEEDDANPLRPMQTVNIVLTKVTNSNPSASDTGPPSRSSIPAQLLLINDYEVKLFRRGGVIRDMFRKLNLSAPNDPEP